MDYEDKIFMEGHLTPQAEQFVGTLLKVRRDLFIDPTVAEPWSCDPGRCRAALGKNLCCKVEIRCRHLDGDRCGIHNLKPFSCAIFPLDLVRLDGIRIVSTVKNVRFFNMGWSRFDRDMLRCFEGRELSEESMFEVQKKELLQVFTISEVTLMERTLAEAAVSDGE